MIDYKHNKKRCLELYEYYQLRRLDLIDKLILFMDTPPYPDSIGRKTEQNAYRELKEQIKEVEIESSFWLDSYARFAEKLQNEKELKNLKK